jgi:hypothetical protein
LADCSIRSENFIVGKTTRFLAAKCKIMFMLSCREDATHWVRIDTIVQTTFRSIRMEECLNSPRNIRENSQQLSWNFPLKIRRKSK